MGERQQHNNHSSCPFRCWRETGGDVEYGGSSVCDLFFCNDALVSCLTDFHLTNWPPNHLASFLFLLLVSFLPLSFLPSPFAHLSDFPVYLLPNDGLPIFSLLQYLLSPSLRSLLPPIPIFFCVYSPTSCPSLRSLFLVSRHFCSFFLETGYSAFCIHNSNNILIPDLLSLYRHVF